LDDFLAPLLKSGGDVPRAGTGVVCGPTDNHAVYGEFDNSVNETMIETLLSRYDHPGAGRPAPAPPRL